MSTLDILRAARHELWDRGLCKTGLTDTDARVCIIGAIGLAIRPGSITLYEDEFGEMLEVDPSAYGPESREAMNALREQAERDKLPVKDMGLGGWNNDPDTDVRDVLGLFDRTIAHMEEENDG